MNRNMLYATVGALVLICAVLGYRAYQQRQESTVIQMTIGSGGVSIEKK
jgi:hypothetical protein